MSSSFADIARGWTRKTVSVYRATPGVESYCVGDTQFRVEGGEVMLPDELGQQLELTRLRRHHSVKAFHVTDAGEVEVELYEGVAVQTDPTPPAPDATPAPTGTPDAPPADPPPDADEAPTAATAPDQNEAVEDREVLRWHAPSDPEDVHVTRPKGGKAGKRGG